MNGTYKMPIVSSILFWPAQFSFCRLLYCQAPQHPTQLPHAQIPHQKLQQGSFWKTEKEKKLERNIGICFQWLERRRLVAHYCVSLADWEVLQKFGKISCRVSKSEDLYQLAPLRTKNVILFIDVESLPIVINKKMAKLKLKVVRIFFEA